MALSSLRNVLIDFLHHLIVSKLVFLLKKFFLIRNFILSALRGGKSLTSPVWTRSLIRHATIMPVVVLPLPIWQLKTHAVLLSTPFNSSTMASKSHSLGAFSSTMGILA